MEQALNATQLQLSKIYGNSFIIVKLRDHSPEMHTVKSLSKLFEDNIVEPDEIVSIEKCEDIENNHDIWGFALNAESISNGLSVTLDQFDLDLEHILESGFYRGTKEKDLYSMIAIADTAIDKLKKVTERLHLQADLITDKECREHLPIYLTEKKAQEEQKKTEEQGLKKRMDKLEEIFDKIKKENTKKIKPVKKAVKKQTEKAKR